MPRKGLRLPKVIRVTAALDPETAKIFQRMAEVSGVSLSRTIGAWCAQTADGAAVVTKMYAQAKAVPGRVMSDMYKRDQAMVDKMIANHPDEIDARQVRDWERTQARLDAQPAPPAARPSGRGGVQGVVQALRSSPRPVTRGESPQIVPHSGQGKGKS